MVLLRWKPDLPERRLPRERLGVAMAAGIRHTNVGWAVAGLLAGHLTATVMVTAGLAALLAASPTAMTVLTVAGAVYLCWLGVTTLRHRHAVATAEMLAPTTGRQLFLKGLGVSLLNPKVFLLFLALLPQFVTTGTGWPVPAQLLTLGALHVLNCAIIYATVAFGASAVLTARPRPALAHAGRTPGGLRRTVRPRPLHPRPCRRSPRTPGGSRGT